MSLNLIVLEKLIKENKENMGWIGMFCSVGYGFGRSWTLKRVSFVPLLALCSWCDPQIGYLKCISLNQLHKCPATIETNHLLKLNYPSEY